MAFDNFRKRWMTFVRSPFLPGTVVVLVATVAAGLFAGSYTYATANPMPRDIPTAVTGVPGTLAAQSAFVAGLEQVIGASLRLHHYDSYDQAREAVDQQREFAILQLHTDGADVHVSGASGASVAQLLEQVAPEVGRSLGVAVTVRDINPLQPGDPRGLAIFYIMLSSVVVGFVAAIQLGVHAKSLGTGQMLAFTAGYAVLGGLAIIAAVEWGLKALRLPFAESWLILSLTLFACGAVFHMFSSLFGRWAIAPTWLLLVMLGNPSSGGAVSWPLLPTPLSTVGRWLPPGAAVNALHTAIYFGRYQYAFPFLVLLVWAAAACAVFAFRRSRFPLATR
jgi:hypothetical protein